MKKTDYEEYQRRANNLAGAQIPVDNRFGQYQPSQAETMQRAANMRNVHVPVPYEPLYTKPSRTIHPNTIIAVVNSVLFGVGMALAPQYRVLLGSILAASALTCIIFVGCSMIRRAMK